MRLSTKLKLWSGGFAVAFLAGAVAGAASGVLKRQWRLARRRRKLRERIEEIDRERASLEAQLRHLEAGPPISNP